MRRVLLAAAIGLALGLHGEALAMGSNLDRPSIAIPGDPQTKELDPVARKIAEVLQAHDQEFTGGSFSQLTFGPLLWREDDRSERCSAIWRRSKGRQSWSGSRKRLV